jgi:hypothetical protein
MLKKYRSTLKLIYVALLLNLYVFSDGGALNVVLQKLRDRVNERSGKTE